MLALLSPSPGGMGTRILISWDLLAFTMFLSWRSVHVLPVPSRKHSESLKKIALFQNGSEAGRQTHVFWIKLDRWLSVVGQELGHFFPQAVNRSRETLWFPGLEFIVVQRSKHPVMSQCTALLTMAINFLGTDNKLQDFWIIGQYYFTTLGCLLMSSRYFLQLLSKETRRQPTKNPASWDLPCIRSGACGPGDHRSWGYLLWKSSGFDIWKKVIFNIVHVTPT